jgi:hypothetical protein
MSADVSQALRDAENALRDFIAYILQEKLGTAWESESGVSPDRLQKWQERKAVEYKRQDTGATDERLIYYADLYDLQTILKKHWQHFAAAFGDLKTTEVWLAELERIRDPDAHRRELLSHQRDLIIGISGEIRTKIARYRSAQETSDAYYPRIEFAADNMGNSWKPGESNYVRTKTKLRPGDILEYVVTATDPLGETLEYQSTLCAGMTGHSDEWHSHNSFRVLVTEAHVARLVFGNVRIRSARRFHARGTFDDNVEFTYEVLPPRSF